MHLVSSQTRFAAPPDVVFEQFADHEKFAQIFGASADRVKDGQDEPNGLGSVRRVLPGPLAMEETIVAFDRPKAIDYAITKGGPLKNHLGQIRFVAIDGGTRVDYDIRFESKVPLLGYVVAAALKYGYRHGIKKVQAQLAGR
ncbi:SRPBCC family protein [Polycyclovorans algicola]|uniref:SRPBCC family protein n=1 Tax=Polycyclovorans algicola TaxID=616992 RepID=UPI0004A6E631|nr:SRPBCC family protein [Polycyclovorans algicola]